MTEIALETHEPPGKTSLAIHVFFGPHQTGKDAEGFREQFENADVYVPESIGWTQTQLEAVRQMSDGNTNTLNMVLGKHSKGFSHEKTLMIFGSHKPIVFVDLPSDHPLAIQLIGKKEELNHLLLAETFEKTLEEIKRFWREFGQLEAQRDRYILSQIRPKIQELTEEYPFLKYKRKLKIFMSLGSIHSEILEMDKTIREVGNGKTYEYSFPIAAARKGQRGEAIDDELAFRVFIDTYFSKELSLFEKSAGEDSEERIKFRRKIISSFSFKDAEEMFDRLKRGDKTEDIFGDKVRKKTKVRV